MLDTRFIGRGYGFATAAGREALALFDEQAGHALDTTYSGKAAAAFLAGLADEEDPTLYWSTKSSAPLPPIDDATVHARGPRRMSKWLRRA